MNGSSPYSIRTRDLSLWYGGFQALRGVSLQVRHGLITSLIGPSGCGKTTLLRCFNRVNERYGQVRTTGEIEILGKNIYDPDVSLTELRRTVGMVFQRPNPLPISVRENVLFGLRLHAGRGELGRSHLDEVVELSLAEVGLWDDLKDRLKERATGLQLERARVDAEGRGVDGGDLQLEHTHGEDPAAQAGGARVDAAAAVAQVAVARGHRLDGRGVELRVVLAGLLDRLTRDADGVLPAAVIALGCLQDLLVLGVRGDAAFDTCHGLSSYFRP